MKGQFHTYLGDWPGYSKGNYEDFFYVQGHSSKRVALLGYRTLFLPTQDYPLTKCVKLSREHY